MIILILRMIKTEKILKQCLSQCLLFHHSTMCPLTENYLLEKSLKQKRKLENIFIPDSNLKLKSLRAELSIFSPSFFTKSLPMFEAEKILVTDNSANHIENSYAKLEIPTGSSPELQETLKKFTGDEIRIGRIMEVMDSMAGMISYRHCFGFITQKNPFIFVTGSVDSINLFSRISCKSDITLEGYINKVGKTSMEIEINLFQDKILKSNALFTMISRSAENHNNGYQCPKLLTTNLSPVEKKKA
jgi:acyl-CoA hydrolase